MTKNYKILFLPTLMIQTMISISSYSWLGMWLGLEINLLSIIPLMHTPKNILSAESSIKYLLYCTSNRLNSNSNISNPTNT